jgi:hypothetical protein
MRGLGKGIWFKKCPGCKVIKPVEDYYSAKSFLSVGVKCKECEKRNRNMRYRQSVLKRDEHTR